MADIKINTQFDVARGRMRLVFSEKIEYIEMSIDQAIAVLSEVVARCQHHKVLGDPVQERKPG
jgi:phosphosulfolactate synthase (CoM biosynthesis protein A)